MLQAARRPAEGCRERGAAGQCQPSAADQFLQRTRRDCRAIAAGPGQIGCGGVDLSFQTPGSEHPDELMEALELFGQESAAAHPRHLKIGAAICHDPGTSFSSTVPLAEQSAEAYPPLWGVPSSPLDRGNMPYIQISDDVRSPAGAGA
jgi:hypothetical protein